MTTKPVTNQEELICLVLDNLSTQDDKFKQDLQYLLSLPIVVTECPLVDPSAEAINGGKTQLCEPIFTKDQEAILNDAFKDCFKSSITK